MLNTSDQALADLLERLKISADPEEIRRLSNEIERLIFHKQVRLDFTEEGGLG